MFSELQALKVQILHFLSYKLQEMHEIFAFELCQSFTRIRFDQIHQKNFKKVHIRWTFKCEITI